MNFSSQRTKALSPGLVFWGHIKYKDMSQHYLLSLAHRHLSHSYNSVTVVWPNPAYSWGDVAWPIILIFAGPHCGLCNILVHSSTFKQTCETPHSLSLYHLLWGHNSTTTWELCIHQMLSTHTHAASLFLPSAGILTRCAPPVKGRMSRRTLDLPFTLASVPASPQYTRHSTTSTHNTLTTLSLVECSGDQLVMSAVIFTTSECCYEIWCHHNV